MTDPSKPMPPNVLKAPDGMAPSGMIMDMSDMTEAYVKAVIAIPAMLNVLAEGIAELTDTVSVLALYCEKKGLAEGVLAPDDLEDDGDGQGPDKTA
jgi:hypothetical protein